MGRGPGRGKASAPLDLGHDAEFAQLVLHTQTDMNGMDGRGTIAVAVGSPMHYALFRLIEAARRVGGKESDTT